MGTRVMLAQTWDGRQDLSGWFLSQKFDGIHAEWDGRWLLTRQGHRIYAPAWFTAGLPPVSLEGELWLGFKRFGETSAIVSRREPRDADWRPMRFFLFDTIDLTRPFLARWESVVRLHKHCVLPAHVLPVEQVALPCNDVIAPLLASVEAQGGEGLMARRPGSPYRYTRSPDLLKIVSVLRMDARVVGYEPGKGKNTGLVGALKCEALETGTLFDVGSGLSDADRVSPPPVGAVVVVQYRETNPSGAPRFPSYVGVRPPGD